MLLSARHQRTTGIITSRTLDIGFPPGGLHGIGNNTSNTNECLFGYLKGMKITAYLVRMPRASPFFRRHDSDHNDHLPEAVEYPCCSASVYIMSFLTECEWRNGVLDAINYFGIGSEQGIYTLVERPDDHSTTTISHTLLEQSLPDLE